ncbi:hypothetical protein [Nocardioides sp. YIM 152588]|uniref:hypothetical protein n=1 Tax=Nocardioides sp. YIM 152588 TaxID=3158259 RepID=UPI0032E3C205
MRKVIVLAVVLLVALAPGVASAATKTVVDGSGPEQSNKGNRLISATIIYGKKRVVWKVRLEKASKKKTRVFAGIYFPDGDFTRVWTLYRKGEKVVRARAYSGTGGTKVDDGISARWNFERDVIRIVLRSTSDGWTHPKNKRAGFAAYTVAKGALHGPGCADPADDCNDDYVYVPRLRKG